MRKVFLLMIFGMMVFGLCAITVETGSIKGFLYAGEDSLSYDKWLSHVAEGIASSNYNLYAPYDRQLNGFGDYHIASTAELTNWGYVVDSFLSGDYDNTELLITTYGFPYQVVEFHDTDSGRTFYMLRENVAFSYTDNNNTDDTYDDEIGAFAWGWGLYIYNPEGTRPILVTAPHPCDDYPSVPFALEAFQLWNAKFLLLAGAGREVRWTNVAPFTNAKSLSDPTRIAAHPFNICYQKFANEIRSEFNMREFSPQMHTYDWNRHVGIANIQLSAGYQKYCPNLPIRDLSSLKHDLINKGANIMIPANTFGIHKDVYLNDYYAVFYSTHDFTFSDGVHTYPVNDEITLPAYSANSQMLYTLNGWNDYDTYDPFLHAEMDELPNCYEETDNNLKWFYGWDQANQRWDFSKTYVNFNNYYHRWIDDLNSLYSEMFQMNDGTNPANPENLSVLNESLNSVTLGWDRSDGYDFDTYEVLYGTEPIGLNNYTIYSRTSSQALADQACESIVVPNLANSNTYYFRLRAKDKNGNYSSMSNQVVSTPGPANITSFLAHGMTNSVRLYWTVGGQTNNLGFKIYRRDNLNGYQLLDSYQTNPALSNSTASSFEWWDNTALNNETYTYKISSTNGNSVEYYYYPSVSASPRMVHTIYIKNASGALADSISFAINPYATDGADTYYDVSKGNPGSNYVWNAFWEQYWGTSGTQLSREVKADINLDNELQTWVMRVRSDQLSQNLYISTSDTFGRFEKLYLQDGGTGAWHDLTTGQYQFTVANSNVRTMSLFWGNLSPKINITNIPNRVYQGGTTATFNWNYTYPFLVGHSDLWITNGTDSLMIAENIPSTVGSNTYYVPQTMDMQNCRIVMHLTAVDGAVTRYEGTYTFAMVPAMSFAYNDPGWKMRSNPWNTSAVTFENVFGTGSVGYNLNQGDSWATDSNFLYGKGYFVNSPDINFYSTLNTVVRDEVSFTLVPGWNLVPNPHLCAYDISDIRFLIGTTVFRMSEMISFGLISRGSYIYRNGEYVLSDTMQPYEALLIKYYGSQSLGTQINFLPYFSSLSVDPPVNTWSLKLEATRGRTDKDAVLIGSNRNASDGYDFVYDWPKALAGPFEHISMSLRRTAPEDSLFLDNILFSEIRSDFSATEAETETWNFKLESDGTDPIDFSFIPTGIPQDWTVSVYVDGVGHHLYNGTSFSLTPDANGDIEGTIIVRNYFVSNDDEILSPITAVKNYPNPFNPSTTLSFYLSQKEQVKAEIFNLRGQRVATLIDAVLEPGAKEFVWNGQDNTKRNVASGVYFIRINTGKSQFTHKMLLLK